MKKFLSIILSLTLLMSMSVSAAASETNEGTQTVSVDVPIPCSYTLTIPASCSIEYGNTNEQSIGSVTVTSDYWDNINAEYSFVRVNVTQDSSMEGTMYLSNDMGDHIPCIILQQDSNGIFDPAHETGLRIDLKGNSNTDLFIKVGDWSNAIAGTTYRITLTYTSRLVK